MTLVCWFSLNFTINLMLKMMLFIHHVDEWFLIENYSAILPETATLALQIC
ncbi:hypothetical protein M975_1601 [Buttiauxella brennerae ATCC 51605]|uniref:Uncharacterized protein n=1 Tax=Buttiauxella brennerae ATCC 51605 TaxID=1354251 RepID=A0A1B7IRQ5_9ENTR|nr:hypothetical protein M975_1601 [Buttiauxella brennerae ATCC 51605]